MSQTKSNASFRAGFFTECENTRQYEITYKSDYITDCVCYRFRKDILQEQIDAIMYSSGNHSYHREPY